MSAFAAIGCAVLALSASAQSGYPYTVVDLVGVPDSISGHAVRINSAGQVLGNSYGAAGRTEPWLAFLWDNGTVIEIGAPGRVNVGTGLNDAGDVCGNARDQSTNDSRAFRWSYVGRQFVDLGTLGGANSTAVAINSAGDVAGYAQLPDGRWHAFVYRGGSLVDLGTLGGTNSYAVAINNAGMVLGASDVVPGSDDRHAFVWQDGVMRDIGSLGGPFTAPRDINEAGQVTGTSTTAAADKFLGFFYSNGLMEPLGGAAISTEGLIVNEPGHVAGVFSTLPDLTTQLFFYAPEPGGPGTVRLWGAPRTASIWPYAMNASDRIVGMLENVETYQRGAFLFDPHGAAPYMFALQSMIPPDSGWRLVGAFDINDAGEIVGMGVKDDQFGPYLLRPVR